MVDAQTFFRSLASGSTVASDAYLSQILDGDDKGLSADAIREIKRLQLPIAVDPRTREVLPSLPKGAKK